MTKIYLWSERGIAPENLCVTLIGWPLYCLQSIYCTYNICTLPICVLISTDRRHVFAAFSFLTWKPLVVAVITTSLSSWLRGWQKQPAITHGRMCTIHKIKTQFEKYLDTWTLTTIITLAIRVWLYIIRKVWYLSGEIFFIICRQGLFYAILAGGLQWSLTTH